MAITESEARVLIHRALTAKSPDALDAVMVLVVAAGLTTAEIEPIAESELASAPHDVREFWLGACNCDGHLN